MNRLLNLLVFYLLFSSCTNNSKQLANEKNIAGKASLKFDKIIFSTSNCMSACPMSNIIISADGTVVFKGQGRITKKGLFIGKVSEKFYQQLENQFNKTNFDSLKNKYESRMSDQQTVTTTFVKNGRIFKTVYDYGRIAPDLLTLSYTQLENLYQNIPLIKTPDPEFIPQFEDITDSKLKKGDIILDLRQSETFLLMDYLRNGKISSHNFRTRFKLHTGYDEIMPLYDIETDGRYYKFSVKGKPVTIDIGFNFYDVNAKNWVWRKADEYD